MHSGVFDFELKHDPIAYLFGSRRQAWVKHQTLVKILEKSANDPEVEHWKEKRDTSAIVARIRKKQMPDGSFPCLPWMHVHEYYFHRLLEMGYGFEDETVRCATNNLLEYQLPEGGYMHPTGRKVNIPDPVVGWAPCMTGYVTKALMDLGLGEHPSVVKSLQIMRDRQTYDGGWICREGHCVDECNCIISGTPWVLACLSTARMVSAKDPIGQKAIRLFSRYKQKIMKHGYMDDRCFRCDEALVLPSLHRLGLSKRHPLLKDLWKSLVNKQQPDGSWLFRGKPSPWYTIEVLLALSVSA